MSTAAGWTGLGVNAALFVFSGLFLRPRGYAGKATPVSYNLAWFMLTIAALFNVVRFTAEALKFGRVPDLDYATNWVRYTGNGLAITAFIGMMVALNQGGFEHFLFTLVPVLGYGTLLVFAALSFETNDAVIAFFTIAAFLYICSIMAYCWWNASSYKLVWWIPTLTFIVEGGFSAMAGVEVFKRSVASNEAEDWTFAAFSVLNCVWFVFVYWIATVPNAARGIGGTSLSHLFYGPDSYSTIQQY